MSTKNIKPADKLGNDSHPMKKMSPSKSTQLLKAQGSKMDKGAYMQKSPKVFDDARGSLPQIKTSIILTNENNMPKEKFTPLNKY